MGYLRSLSIKDIIKDLVWDDCEDNEFPYLESSNSATHGYIIVEDGWKFYVSYYPLSGGHARQATGFGKIEEAKEWCFNHWVEKITPYIKDKQFYC